MKNDLICLVAHTALSSINECLWYLNSACSRQLFGDMSLFDEIELTHGGRLTFGDGSIFLVEGKGSFKISGLPIFQNVYCMSMDLKPTYLV